MRKFKITESWNNFMRSKYYRVYSKRPGLKGFFIGWELEYGSTDLNKSKRFIEEYTEEKEVKL